MDVYIEVRRALAERGASERILAKVFILLCMDFSIPRCEVMFSFVAMAMLGSKQDRGEDL